MNFDIRCSLKQPDETKQITVLDKLSLDYVGNPIRSYQIPSRRDSLVFHNIWIFVSIEGVQAQPRNRLKNGILLSYKPRQGRLFHLNLKLWKQK